MELIRELTQDEELKNLCNEYMDEIYKAKKDLDSSC